MQETNPSLIANYQKFINRKSKHAFFVYNVDSDKLEYVNKPFEQIWQRDIRDLQKNFISLLDTVHPQDREHVSSILKDRSKGAEKKNGEFRIGLPNNSCKWICLKIYTFVDDENSHTVIGIVEDITKNKEYILNLLKYNAKKDSTLEILSHDLASPLNSIQGFTSYIAKRIEQYNDPELEEMLSLMHDTCKRGVDLIRDFVAQEFLESSNVDINKQRVDLVEKIGETIDTYKKGEGTINKTFHLITSNKHVFAFVDTMKFMQVINNLISNAIKFTYDGGIITIRIEDKDNSVLVAVEDNGIGIPARLQEGLFEKFTKARRPGLKGEKSTGLGMSIIKTIVEWHGGTIRFKSEENKGTSFYIVLPNEGY